MHISSLDFFSLPAKMSFNMVFLPLLMHLSLFLFIINLQICASEPSNLIEGFISLPLDQSNPVIQRPYDVPEDQRYNFIDGVHKLWVYSTDKPHSPISKTSPRTEIRIHVSNVKILSLSLSLSLSQYLKTRVTPLDMDTSYYIVRCIFLLMIQLCLHRLTLWLSYNKNKKWCQQWV